MEDKNEKQKREELPTAVAALDQLVRFGTVLEFSGKPILFSNSRQSAVKELQVNICSTESQDKPILHKLHTQNQIIKSW